MANAVNELDRISSDPLARKRAQEREDSIRMYEDSLAVSHREGKAEGKAEGKTEGKAELVIKLLTLRFGAVDAVNAERVRTASPAELDTFAERVLSARDLDDVLAD